MTGCAARKKRRRGTMGGRPVSYASQPWDRKVYDVWMQPTVADVYAQLKVAAQMLSRIDNPNLAVVKREMYLLEDMLWQFR